MRSARASIPSFSLYGESPVAGPQADGVHIEDIQSRSRKYLWKIGSHRHTLLSQCLLVNAGPVTAALDEARAVLAGPAVMIIPPGTVHSFRFGADTQGYVLTLDLARVLSMASARHRAPIDALFAAPRLIELRGDLPLAGRIASLFERLACEFAQPDSSAAPIGGWLACCVLWTLAAATATDGAIHGATHGAMHGATPIRGSRDALRLQRLRHLIEAHYLKHWPVRRYARQLALSETSLNRLCRQLAGCTAFDMIQQRLALEARRRLVYGASAVGAVAAELGFRDAAYFSRFFRRHGGVSPVEFRRRHHGESLGAEHAGK